jgi:hypothetical protein
LLVALALKLEEDDELVFIVLVHDYKKKGKRMTTNNAIVRCHSFVLA